MPTHSETEQFKRDWARLSPEEKQQFREAVRKFVKDLLELPRGQLRKGLRVKSMQGTDGIFEMTWEIANGRTTFEYGEERAPGDPHIVWRRIGGHDVFDSP